MVTPMKLQLNLIMNILLQLIISMSSLKYLNIPLKVLVSPGFKDIAKVDPFNQRLQLAMYGIT